MNTNNNYKIDKFLEKAMNKMFQMIGMKGWDKEFTKQPDWFSQKTWTNKQMESYKNWFLVQIKEDLKISKKEAENEWNYFHLMWGWKEQI